MIKVKNLVKKYGSFTAVDGVSFEVTPGEVVGFLGPNGAGKTTTLRMMTCYLEPDGGSIEIKGMDVASESLKVRECVGYLPENNPLYPDMTPEEYLSFIAGMRGMDKTSIADRVRAVANMTRLGDMFTRPIAHLSKGYKQRVGLAAALIHDPDYLILDEPTSGLDPTQIIEVRKLIRQVAEKKSIILSTHILQEVTAICDRVIIIDNGRIVFQAALSELPGHSHADEMLHVTVSGDADQVQAAVCGLDDVTDVTLRQNGDWCDLDVTSPQGKDLSEAIFSLAVEKGWTLKRLERETQSLESIFLNLTRGERPGDEIADSQPAESDPEPEEQEQTEAAETEPEPSEEDSSEEETQE